MSLFSERYGYTNPRNVLIKEQINEEIENAICSGIDILRQNFRQYSDYHYYDLEEIVWIYFMHQRKSDFIINQDIIPKFIKNKNKLWYEKLDLLEFTIKKFKKLRKNNIYPPISIDEIITWFNNRFKELGFGYRFVNEEIVEITSEEEIREIEEALGNCKDNVRHHLDLALSLYAKKPEGDYVNSIKESISAIEAVCRDLTGESTLGKAISKLEDKGVKIPETLRSGLIKLYTYTNQPETGIRHALMDDKGEFIPDLPEARFMLVTSSAFINYLRDKSL